MKSVLEIAGVRCKDGSAQLTHDFKFLHPIIQAVIFSLGNYVKANFKQEITITCINRTLRQNAIDGGIIKSAHLDWRAVDLRSRNFKKVQLVAIESWLKRTFGDMIYVNISDHGTAPHMHINLKYAYA